MSTVVTVTMRNSRIRRLIHFTSVALLVWGLSFAAPVNAGYTANWQSLATTDTPTWRVWTAMTWASGMNRIVLWGGWGSTFVNDMYTLDPLVLDWQMIQPYTYCPGNSGFDTPNGSDENGVVYDPINNMLWIANGGSGYRCIVSRTAGTGTTANAIVDSTLTSAVIDFYKDFQVSDLTHYAVVTAYDPATHTLSLDNPLTLAPGSSYQLFADAGAGTWSYSFATGVYSKLEARHWGYTGPVPTGSRLSPGFASNGSTYAILFGGVGSYNFALGAYDNSTWKLDFASKSYSLMLQMSASGPAARAQIENQFVYDELHNRFVLFGGRCRDPDRCGFAGNRLNDTWVYDPQANVWTELFPAVSPPPRDQAQMYFDSAHGVVVLYGGADINGVVLGDLWVFDLGTQTWTQVSPTGSPIPVNLAPVAYAPTTGCGYLVQGTTTGGVASNGVYEICLTSSSGNIPPVANITVTPASGSAGTVFNLYGGASSDSDGTIVSFAWNFGDGTSATGASVTKSYTAPGSYAVTLTVTDNLGATGSRTTNINITANAPPTVGLTSPANGATFTAPATVALAATAADADGTVAHVDFYRGTTLIGSDTSAPYTYSDSGLAAGTYSYTAVAYDNAGASTTSTAATITVSTSGTTSANVASAANGGVASASSFYSTNYAPAGAINGDRKGLNWGSGGGWNDSSASSYPDWLQVTFSATQTIGEIDVFSVQDNYAAPVAPTLSTTFSLYGITSFEVQYWNGTAWTDVPGGNVTGNNLVWRQFTFTPVTTDRIRVLVNNALAGYSRITEVEAWTVAGGTTNAPPTVGLTSPANGATFTAPATVALAATAADADGTVAHVDFYRGTTLIGSDTSAPYTYSDSGLAAGTYSYTAVAYDNAGASTTSTAATITVSTSGTTSANVASAANGGVASASSFYSTNYAPAGAINGDRKGLNWGSGGGWNDSSASSYPDWLQVTFSATQTIGEIDVFSVQDNYAAPVDPTLSTTFSLYGITSFEVQYWNGTAWTDVPGGNVTGNNLVWRQFTFTPVTTDRIRVLVNNALASYSRITEVEAWTAAGGTTNAPPTVGLTSPANGATFTAPATVALAATAADADGTVAHVDFYRGTTLIGSDTSAPYTYSDSGLAAGTYSYTAVAYDNAGASTTSTAATITVSTSGTTSANVASAANGGVASASSFYSTNYAPAGAINGDRKGLNWGSGGGWNDSSASSYPDWLQVTFSATQTIGEIDVFSVQDNYAAPVAPTLSTTFSLYGITSFEVQYWNGTAWTDVPGGNVTGNNLVWRQFTFTPVTTDRIRVLVNNALAGYSRITEIEAWTP